MEENIFPAAPVLQVKERTTGTEESGGGCLHEAAAEAGAHLPGHDPRIKGTDQHCAPRSCACRDGEDTEPPGRRQGKQAHPPSGFVPQASWGPAPGRSSPALPVTLSHQDPTWWGVLPLPARAWADCCIL